LPCTVGAGDINAVHPKDGEVWEEDKKKLSRPLLVVIVKSVSGLGGRGVWNRGRRTQRKQVTP
jgi:hypothetical protein